MLDRFIGVDIGSIGGTPSESLIDGEKLPDTSVGGAVNGTTSAKDEELDNAKWAAYRKSGEVVLALVAIAAAGWGFYVWRIRRRSRGYAGLPGGALEERRGATGLESFRNKRSNRDLEIGDFDEGELDDLHIDTPDREHYSIGDASDDEDGHEKTKNGQASRA
jgi:carboxypeptidase D